MKFIVILTSMLLIIFGGLLSYVYDKHKDDIRLKVNYSSFTQEKQLQIDQLMIKLSNILFVGFLLGVCLFIAGLFI